MIAWSYLLLSLVGFRLTWNAFRPKHAPVWRAFASFVAGWLVSELPLHHIAVQALVSAAFFRWGAFESFPGRLGLALTIASWSGLWICHRRSREAAGAMERALREGLGEGVHGEADPLYASSLPLVGIGTSAGRSDPSAAWTRTLLPIPLRPPEVERIRDIRYHRAAGLNLKLDVYRHRSPSGHRPVLLEVHGGGWVFGSKNEQGIPLMLRMASRGWVCVAADYRLCPHATFPEPVIDLKRAIRWIREHGREYGADPDFIVVAGQSAGGHLASLLALTPNDPELQPGFESVDTRLAGCVSFYGVYDFLDRHELWSHDGLFRLLETRVMKASREEAPEAYEKASPMGLVRADAPPFLVVHGSRDSVVPVEEARRFVAALRARSRSPVAYAEVPGAQHAFEIFPSLRTELVLDGVESFLSVLFNRHVAGRGRSESPFPAAS